ncbi:TlpA family protein disulfide reductase [Paenibacillaceae bacterium]|nr:TlpA family protein disulfide reductase [Paenibacillaceae bacterium]
MKRTVTIIIITAVLVLLAVYQNNEKQEAAAMQAAETKPAIGFAAPAFELTAIDEQTYRVGGERDKPLLLNFWASWCGPCELEAPDLQELYETFGDRIDLYGVNATSYDRERMAREFVDSFGLTFPIPMDREGVVANQYRVISFPTTLLIDREGIIRERIPGVITKQEWERKIRKWIE